MKDPVAVALAANTYSVGGVAVSLSKSFDAWVTIFAALSVIILNATLVIIAWLKYFKKQPDDK